MATNAPLFFQVSPGRWVNLAEVVTIHDHPQARTDETGHYTTPEPCLSLTTALGIIKLFGQDREQCLSGLQLVSRSVPAANTSSTEGAAHGQL